MGPQAKELTYQIFERVNSLPYDREPSEFELRSIEKDIAKVRSIDALAAFQLAGALASVRGDIDAMHRNHKAALRLGSGSTDAWTNYACSLMRLGYLSEGLDKLRNAFSIDPMDVEVLKELIDAAYLSGRFSEAADLLKEFEKRCPNQQHHHATGIGFAQAIQREYKLSDDHTSSLVDLALGAAHAAGALSIQVAMGVVRDDDSAWASLSVIVNRPNKISTSELNLKLAEKIVDSEVDPTITSVLTVRFTSAKNADLARRMA
jgi:tetratricopeptide (TPR) repeat protein